MAKNKYGRFSDDGGEFIISRPDTPRPWINYLTNGNYCALISHIGGGLTFYKDQWRHSVLRRGFFQYLEDMPARLFYIKDEESGEVWTANVYPLRKFDKFESRHGIGYTLISSSYKGIAAKLTYFVPHDTDAEVWRCELTNTGKKPRKLSVYSYAELTLGHLGFDEGENQFGALFNDVKHDDRQMVFWKRRWFLNGDGDDQEWIYRVFSTTTVKPVSMVSDRDEFIGAFGSYERPAGVVPKVMPVANGAGKNLVSVYQWRVQLKPSGAFKTSVVIGLQKNVESPTNQSTIDRFKTEASCDAAYEATCRYWKDLLAPVSVKTPDKNVNHLMNNWTKFQLLVNFWFGRGPSYYHRGQTPAMRDSSQDTFGVCLLSPALARESILRIGQFFYKDGRAAQFCNRVGVRCGPTQNSDLPLWYIMPVAVYIRETGDWSILDEQIPLYDEGTSTVYQKIIQGIDRMFEKKGAHGLPLMKGGDWNDAANMVGAQGRGESVWLAQFLYFIINEVAPLMVHKSDTAKLESYRRRADELRKAVHDHCWDGEWFVRAFKDDGTPLGAKGQKEGFIWINSQTWAVISGISTPERMNKAMDSVEKHMGTPYGLTNLAPAYTKIDETIGIITGFRPGWKENAAVFSHASSFNVVARALLGRGKDALDLFKRILPTSKDSDKYLLEPYAFTQFCAGPASGKEFGRASFHWLSGTSAWMFRAMYDYIIGVRAEYDGLRVAPTVDPSWKTFSMTRRFRGSIYEFEFVNPQGKETGVKEVWLDGKQIPGTLLPLPTAPKHRVRVVMG
jgi:cellobiose phosphorylase